MDSIDGRCLARLRTFAACAAVAITAVACGGGGGGGGGGGFPLGPISQPSAPEPETPANTSPLKLDVKINDVASAPITENSLLELFAGDTVEVSVNQDVTWEGRSNTPSNVVTVANAQTSPRKWSGQITSAHRSNASYTISVTSIGASAPKKIDVELRMKPADQRNGEYRVFATNGTKPTLKLDFDRKTYKMTDATGASESGGFSPDANVQGTYVFANARITGTTNTARFRVFEIGDYTVVGSFPFAIPGGTHAVRPFVAARLPIQAPEDIEGNYNGFGTSMAGTVPDSSINSLRISDRGAKMELCTDDVIYNVTSCPPASLKTYTVSRGTTDGAWRAVNNADSADVHNFSVVRMDNDKIYLEADKDASGAFVFRIGLQDGGNPGSSYEMLAYGGATDGSWGLSRMNPVRASLYDYATVRQSSAGPGLPAGDPYRGYVRTAVAPSGADSSMSAVVGAFAVFGPPLPSTLPFPLNVRYAAASPVSYLMARSERLFVRAGPRVPGAAGYLEIGLVEP